MDKFSMFSKWFWVGIAVAAASGFAGLIFGGALATEPERRKEGVVIIVWSAICLAAVAFWAFR